MRERCTCKTVQDGEQVEHTKIEKIIAEKLHYFRLSLYSLKTFLELHCVSKLFPEMQLLVSNFSCITFWTSRIIK